MFYAQAVKYTENGKLIDAIVFQEHFGLASHLGANDEPLVHVIFPDPAKEHLNLADPMLKMIVRHDVAHASHEFDEEEQKKYGEIFAGGRYHETRDPREVVDEVLKAAEDRKAQAAAEAKAAAEKAAAPATPPAAPETPSTPAAGGTTGSVN